MAYVLTRLKIDDYDAWKRERFDLDPADRRQAARGYRILRSADNPSEVFVQVEFDSVDDARAFRDRLIATGVLEHVQVMTPPTVVEVADSQTY
jgi:hypothetical protein